MDSRRLPHLLPSSKPHPIHCKTGSDGEKRILQGGKVRGEIKDEAREGGRMGCEDGGGEEDKKTNIKTHGGCYLQRARIKIHMPNFDI